MPPNSVLIAPCRSRPMSSMLVRPGGHPATRHGTFRCALTPHSPPGRTCSATRSPSPARSARAITGTRPACDTRFGSSNDACVLARGYATIALTRCPLEPGTGSFDNSHSPRSEGTFHVDTPENTLIDRWIEAKSRAESIGKSAAGVPRPLRREHHRPPQPRRMTETTLNNLPLKKTHPPGARSPPAIPSRAILCTRGPASSQLNAS